MHVKYRRFGSLDWRVSALGFGAMRLPVIGGDRGKIDEEKAGAMLRYAFDHGVNYVDTGYPYHDGQSEAFVGTVLQEGYRDTVRVAAKMPIWQVNARSDLDRIFDEQLAKLRTDHVDFYLFHGLREERWAQVQALHALQWAEEQRDAGRIGHLGFSFHDCFDVFQRIVDGYDGWTLCQVQYNYVDQDYQAGTRGVRYAAAKGLAVVVMEPIQGGNLAVPPSPAIQAMWDAAPVRRTPAEWALQWVWTQPEVSVTLSGMSTMEQVVENVRTARRSGPGTLSVDDLDRIARVRDAYQASGFIGCTRCGYCQPCPHGVAIPDTIAFYNEFYTKRGEPDRQAQVKQRYAETIPDAARADRCVQCGECEAKCPQQLPIPHLMTRAARRLLDPGER
jgi:predicted aldo/keto reductase-like oxidoreductase